MHSLSEGDLATRPSQASDVARGGVRAVPHGEIRTSRAYVYSAEREQSERSEAKPSPLGCPFDSTFVERFGRIRGRDVRTIHFLRAGAERSRCWSED